MFLGRRATAPRIVAHVPDENKDPPNVMFTGRSRGVSFGLLIAATRISPTGPKRWRKFGEFDLDAIAAGRGNALGGLGRWSMSPLDTRDFVLSDLQAGGPRGAGGRFVKEALDACRAACDPKNSQTSHFIRGIVCRSTWRAPMTRRWGIDTPRIWDRPSATRRCRNLCRGRGSMEIRHLFLCHQPRYGRGDDFKLISSRSGSGYAIEETSGRKLLQGGLPGFVNIIPVALIARGAGPGDAGSALPDEQAADHHPDRLRHVPVPYLGVGPRRVKPV